MTEEMTDETYRRIAETAANQVALTREQLGVKQSRPETVAAFVAALELNHQLPHDLCGQQREFTLPRVRTLARFFLTRFPHLMAEAMGQAVDGYGDPIGT